MTLTKIGASLGGSADIINVTQTSHTFVSNDRGKAVRMNNNSGTPQYVLAIASATTTADAIGIIIHVTDGNNFTMATSGRITVDACIPSGVAGTVVFLSHTAAGVLTSTEPSAAGHVSKPMAVITIAGSEMIMLQQRGEVISTGAVSIADGSVDNDAMADNAIDTDEIVNDAVTADKLANSINAEIAANTAKVTNATHTGDVTGATALTIATDAVDIGMLSASGTADGTTFLRGDNQWAAAGGGGDLSFGGDTFGAEKIIGSNDAYSLSFETDGVVRMRIDGAAGSYTGAGAITMPSQPCFCVQNDNTDSNIGTSAHLVAWDTERFDQGGDFNVSTEQFIAPTTGRYILNVMLQFTGIATNVTNISVRLDTSNVNYQADSEGRDFQEGEYYNTSYSVIADMNAGDHAKVYVTVTGGSGLVDINSGAFSGMLVA